MPAGILASTAMSRGRGMRRGHTLLELLVVVSVLAVIAAIAAPGFNNNDEAALDRAASQVAGAIRFAHSEAIRTGEPHGVNASETDQRIRIYRLPAGIPIYDVYDPLEKRLYNLDFRDGMSDVAIEKVYFKFIGSSSPQNYLGFSGGTGTPNYNESGRIWMLETASVKLGYGGAQRKIDISPMTGRVKVQ